MILECIQDSDISIQKRALDLAFGMIQGSNIESICRELLGYMAHIGRSTEMLGSESFSLMSYMASHIASVADLYAPSSKWFVDTMLQVFMIAGPEAREASVTGFLRFVAQSSESLQSYATFRLWDALQGHGKPSMDALIQCAAWCIGEYGHCLQVPGTFEETLFGAAISERDIIEKIRTLLWHQGTSPLTRYYLITALAKLVNRFPSVSDLVREIIGQTARHVHVDMELGQRISEYLYLLQHGGAMSTAESGEAQSVSWVSAILDRMPPPKMAEVSKQAKPTGRDIEQQQLWMDMLSGIDLGPGPGPGPALDEPQRSTVSSQTLTESAPALVTAVPASLVSMEEQFIYERNGMEIYLHRFVDPADPASITIRATFKNENQDCAMTNVTLHAAVPKSMKLFMSPISSASVQPRGYAIQIMRVQNPSKAQLKMRFRVEYTVEGDGIVQDTIEAVTFPEE
jgi:AP-1 complex subunit gamma-1